MLLFTPLLVLASAHATTFANRPLSEAVDEAQNIVRGTTGRSYYDYGSDQKKINTYTTLSISEVYKGDLSAGQQIVVRQPGGIMDGVQMGVPGSASFKDGEDVVLMLSELNTDDHSYDVTGMSTGKYNVRKNDDGQLVIVNSMGGGAMYDPKKTAKTLSYDSTIPLQVFKQIAKGDNVPEAKQDQFKRSNLPPPPGSYEANEAAPPAPRPTAAANAPAAPESESGSRPWVAASFALLAAVGLGLLWWVLR